jgi:competence protein ComEC
VVNPSLTTADRERFELEIAPGARAQVSLYAKTPAQVPKLRYGTRVEFTGKIRPVHNFNNPGSFDAVQYFAGRQVFWNGSADASTVTALPGTCGNAVEGWLFRLRAAALERLDALYPEDPYASAMMQAVLLGETTRMERLWTEDYRSTGTYHALVISGSHIAVLSAVLLFLLRLLWLPQWAALTATVSVAWIYAGVTGWQSPVVRSAAGMTLYAVARVFYREGRLLNLLAAVALGFLLFDPSQLFDAGFQLSFLAVAAIGAFTIPAIEATSGPLAAGCRGLADVRRDLRVPPRTAQFRVELRLLASTLLAVTRMPLRFGNLLVVAVARAVFYLYEVALMSLVIQVCLALPMVWYFHRLSFSGVVANVMVLPALTALVPLGFLAIALQSPQLASVCSALLNVSRWAASLNARWEPEWQIPPPPLWLIAALTVVLCFAAWRVLTPRWRTLAWAGVSCLLAILIVHPFAPRTTSGLLELSAIDVGQGDSLLVAFPAGKLMLIDAGGLANFGQSSKARKSGIDVGQDVVSPYLWSRSIRRLDVVVMTHAHEDHMGGMPSVLRNFRPAELWTGAVGESEEWARVRTAARKYGVTIREMRRGAPFAFDKTRIAVLAPDIDYIADSTPKNDDSLVLRIEFGNHAFLLAGDMEKRTERQLTRTGELQTATVLKVGHHGSRTSSTPEFLDLVHPAFAVISDGADNSYGHPHPFTLEALETRRIDTLRTDQRGLVRISSDGRRIRVD